MFVGNIFYEVTEDMLIKFLGEVGPVKGFRLVCDRETGKPKGYGFGEYFDVPTAESAVRNLNGRDLGGRTLRLDFADEGPNQRGADDKAKVGVGQGIGQNAAAAVAMSIGSEGIDEVTNVLASMTKQQLWDLMEQMRTLIQQNHTQARQLLINNPALTKAIFQTQIILGIVKPNQSMDAMPPPPPGSGGAGIQPPPPQPPPFPPMHPGMNGMPSGPIMMPHGAPPPPMAMAAPQGGIPMPPQPQAPMGMMPQQATQQQQQALVQQLLSLTPEQIQMLPPEQKEQVIAVQQQLRQG